ncbi:TonB-dependent receptor [Sphingobacterium sp. SGG-5]|uniref:SusC/RagA family TonB-linked outer membrane protein n=1 Tax=Sphingobacterium sp. SGG-5 TaxID=2710881 RepID=UPI0013EBF913|nr:TonB-dependent receptor [Sphingobacterium sp. SGG-5]NGM60429.1 TonB-dependent receptor [Sphingobacterium sp. SGG-5]
MRQHSLFGKYWRFLVHRREFHFSELDRFPLFLSYTSMTILLLLITLPSVFAENVEQDAVTVTGKVELMVGDTSRPYEGVNVQEKGIRNRTTTNSQGDFSIRVRKGAVLVFSMLGYVTREIAVGTNTTVNVVLVEDLKDLDEVVVTGYQTQERRTITGAMGQVKAADFEDMPIQTFDQAMQGRMAGVLVQGVSGTPGGPMRVEIRGTGSISAGTQPLYIVDGVEISTEEGDVSDVTASNPLALLNPDDIESIEVLKDGAAASIYGAQAANGVVLITTKKGVEGKTNISLNYYKGIQEPVPLLPMMNTQQYLNVRMEAISNLNPDWAYDRVRTEVLSQNQLPVTLTDAEISAIPTYDWQSEAFRLGYTDNVQLVASGGTKQTTFRVSSSFNKTDATVVGNDFMRATLSSRLDHQVNKRLHLYLNTILSTQEYNGSYGSWNSSNWFASPQMRAPLMLPFLPIYLEDGSYNSPMDRFPGENPYNTLQVTEVNTQRARTHNLLGHLRFRYDMTKGLKFESRFGLNYRLLHSEFYQDPRTVYANPFGGIKQFRMQPSLSFTTSQTLTYNKSLGGGHNLNTLLGVEYRSYHRYRVGTTAEGFPSYEFRYLSSAAVIRDAYENITDSKRAGAFSQVNYNYKKKYMFSAVLRYDGSSRFGADNRYGWFPSFSVGWDASQEPFLKRTNWAQQLKLRASYGETGNSAIGDFAARALSDGSGSYEGKPGTSRSQIGNDDLRWERNIMTNVGVDFSFFKRRLYGSVDAFQRRSKDLLLLVPLPNTSGFSSVWRNVAEVRNKGLEVELGSDLIRRGDFRWTSTFNITFIRNRVTRLYRDIIDDLVDEGVDGNEITEDEVMVLPGDPGIRVGYPMYTNWAFQYAGVNAATGKPMWWQGENNLTYAPTGMTAPYGLGNRLSDYYGGVTNKFRYKRVELGIFFQYDMGRELYNQTNTYHYVNGNRQSNSLARVYDARWTTPGQMTTTPRPIDGATEVLAQPMDRHSSRFLEDASYIRLKELSLNYRVPTKYISRFNLRNVDFYVRAVNILTWTKWTGYDPEFYISDSVFTSNQNQIPPARTYTIGFKVGF